MSPNTDLSDVTLEGAPGGARKEEARQRVFDTAARTIYAQGGPAWDEEAEMCAYRSPDGRKCNLGACIPDEVYDANMEGLAPDHDHLIPAVEALGMAHDTRYLEHLQEAHDQAHGHSEFFQEYHRRMSQLAANFGLSTTVLDTLQSGQE